MARRNWERNELLLALNLYCKLQFGQYHAGNPQIVQLAHFINRTPGAVAMKLVNFASFDPFHQQRGITGLQNTSKADREIWDEFYNNWTALGIESELAYLKLAQSGVSEEESVVVDPLIANALSKAAAQGTEIERRVKTRIGQSFFRTVILTSYNQQCCVCALPVPEMLIASHIVPWRDAKNQRLNPHNGLCLCALHDSGFDRGFVTVGEDYEFIVGERLNSYLPDVAIETYFIAHRGKQIQLPDKFVPDQEFLSTHREKYFIG